ncbi:hypothetical protein HYC85_027766 [Camellia sinensis]|uniref:Uncharacterized protein n=1 Tax=Camellia sinensis TaxID=4442 RepID=A0A7J7FT95_CAMSI|nr:hypothetical protein HYC85_027766 [Camellia sinensis]
MDVTIKGESLKGSASFRYLATKSHEHSRRMKLNSLALLTNIALSRKDRYGYGY